MTGRVRSNVNAYLGAVGAVLVAWLIRWVLSPALGDSAPYVTFVGAVLITTWLSGLGPGLLALAMSIGIIVFALLPPIYAFQVSDHQDTVGLALYIVVVLICIGVTEMLRHFHEARAAALRMSDDRFRHLTEAIPSIVWTAAPDGTITYVNKRWFSYCGLPRDEKAPVGPELVIHPDDNQRRDEQWTRALRDGTEYEIEVRCRRHDGTYRWFMTRAVPWKEADGRVLSWFGVTTDIHEQKELQERLHEADRRKDEFLATLAHELRNPLAPLRNAVEVMRLAGDGGRGAVGAREIMERQLTQMVRLVDDLLDLSRITRGRIELRKAPLEISKAVDDALETCRPQIVERGHRLHVELPRQPIHVDADRVRLAQVFTNLLSNACKYTPRGGSISIAAFQEGDDAVVRVTDSGMGIPPELLPRVFEMFSQAVRSNELTEGGLGIGLFLVRGIVEQHGGRVEARSNGAGRGSEFTVRLPVARPAPLDPRSDGHAGDGTFRGRRVLVADDNKDAADSLAEMLSCMGHETRAAYDGVSAIESAAAYRPEVILLDLGMPKMDGYEAARRIREQEWSNGVVLVALTGWGQEEDRIRAKKAGFDFHLTKPADPRALGKLIGEVTVGGKLDGNKT